jgi:hypothetical protein
MKNYFTIFFLTFFFGIFNSASSQNPLVKQWDYRYGGIMYDFLQYFEETPDNGFILGGLTSSDSAADKTNNSYGSIDYWIVKTDQNGIKLWDVDFGGTAADFFSCGDQTTDGGFIFGGYSESGISGSKTEACRGDVDYWIVKTDSLGNKLWDKTFGGAGEDHLTSVQQTSEGGYILGGFSFSAIGGDKSQNSWGECDYWIVKTDAQGNKIWDRDFGGTQFDYRGTVKQTDDHGYIIAGYSDSPVSGDKSQNSWGESDYWLVKTDSLGNKIWDKDLGGLNDDNLSVIQPTSDHGFILGGLSESGIGGDKTMASWNNTFDFWIIKADANGNIQWDKDFGGSDIEDEFTSIFLAQDKGFLIAGNSYSPISGDKSENNLGIEQSWVLKLDSTGAKEWDKTPLTSGHDEIGFALETKEGCIVIANSTYGDIAGEKTQDNWGAGSGADYWIIKYCDSLIYPHAGFNALHHLCPGTCASFTNLSLYATSYLWSFPGATPNSSTDIHPANICYNIPGSYDVILIASSSFGSDTIMLPNYVTVYPYPSPQGIQQNGDTLFAIQGSVSYQWYFNGNPVSGATDYFYVAPISGDYNVVATDANGCEVEAVVFNVVANIQPPAESGLLTVFPNPVGETLHVKSLPAEAFVQAGYQLTGTAVEISIYNMLGELVLAVPPLSFGERHGGEAAVDCRLLPSGLYYLKISANEKSFRTRFIKQ